MLSGDWDLSDEMEFVAFEDGQELEWVEPMVSVRETDEAWFVDSGHYVYEVAKRPGMTAEVRPRREA